MNILALLQQRFAEALADFTETPAEFAAMVRPAGDAKFGDFQANCCMPLGKRNGVNPRDLAVRLVDKLDVTDICEPPEVAGPGFINLTVRQEVLEKSLQRISASDRLGVDPVSAPRNIVVDFSSPNVAKPMHVGHLRSTVIGDSICRILRFLGHHVISDNHIGDWGTQFGMIIYGYKHFLNAEAYAADPVPELSRLYRLVNQLSDYPAIKQKLPRLQTKKAELEQEIAELRPAVGADKSLKKKLAKAEADLRELVGNSKDPNDPGEIELAIRAINAVDSSPVLRACAQSHPDIARLAREETAKLHAGDAENRKLWHQFLPQCLQALQRVYDRLGIEFDHQLGESYYDEMLSAVVADLQARGLAKESGGAQCVFVAGNEAPFIVQKSDGAFTYATTDLATIKYRVDQFGANEMLYVVDARQGEHFKLLFATAENWGFDKVKFSHVSFGTVMGKDKRPYKTRSGDTVGLESLLDEAVSKAREIVAANDDSKKDENEQPVPELDEATRDRIAEIVGLGGIKYADLHHNRESDYVFDWDKMLATTGDTATYMQYAYARVCGILRKGCVTATELQAIDGPIAFTESAERALVLKVCRFGEALDGAALEYRPNLLTQYLFELAGDLTTFYANCPVLKGTDTSTRQNRLRLVEVSGRVIRKGLELLGIQVSDRM